MLYITTFLLGLLAIEDPLTMKFTTYQKIANIIRTLRGFIIIIGYNCCIRLIFHIVFGRKLLDPLMFGFGRSFPLPPKIQEIFYLLYLAVLIPLVFLSSLQYLKPVFAKIPEILERLNEMEEKTKPLIPKLGYLALVLTALFLLCYILIKILYRS